jgi:hypothetical protein
MNRTLVLCGLLLASLISAAQTSSNTQSASADSAAAQKVPVIDGAAGSCSLELTITADSKPVYAATVKVHIAYGFGGLHKLDLEASTNVDGKVKFAGLPSKVRRQTLEFNATKDQLAGTMSYDPASECKAVHTITLEKAKPETSK